MNDERNRDQIVRKDARGCFVESLSDAFGIGKAHFAFAAYLMHGSAVRKENAMFKVIATDVVVSEGYDNTPALKFSERGDSVRFRIGKKVYDTRAKANHRWVNLSVKAFGPVCERIRKMQLRDGSFVNILGRLDEDTWEDSTRSSTAPVAQTPNSSASSRLLVLRPTLPHPHRLSLSPTTALRGLSLSAGQTHSSMTDQTHHARKGAHGLSDRVRPFSFAQKGEIMNRKNYKKHVAYELLVVPGISAILLFVCRLWPLLILALLGMLGAAAWLILANRNAEEPEKPGALLPSHEFVTACTIEKIVKLMRTAFRRAVRWGLIGSNPFDNAVLPKREKKERAIWDVKTIRKALDECEDGRLFIALNLAFACSMRLGEITGLQWDCVDISDRAIANDDASIRIERELERVDQEAINALGNADIIMVFPRVMVKKSKTRLVLKKPKTDTSIRTVWIPKTLALILREWRQRQEAWKEFMGEDYVDYNLVLAQENGRPCEDRIIGNAFARLKEKADLPDVVFHSLRHSSTTYKLKINHGDIKATQGDTGHAGPEMVTKVYAHILDEDRKINAQKFEAAFYSNPDMRQIEAQSAQKSLPPATADLGRSYVNCRSSPDWPALWHSY